MTLTLCIVRKDLYRLRWWVVTWLGVLVVPILLGVHIIRGEVAPVLLWRQWEDMVNYLNFLRWLFAYLIVIILIHEDGLVGGRHLWMTRPIGGLRLLRAKAAMVTLLFVVAPIVVCIPWWSWCGFSVANMATAAIEVAGVPLVIAVLTAFIAVLTDSVARTLLWTLVLVAAPMTILALTVVWSQSGTDNSQFIMLRLLVAASIAVLFAGVAVIVQHVKRDRRSVLVVAGVATVVLALGQLSMTFQSSWWRGPTEPREVSPARAKDVVVSFTSAVRKEGEGGKGQARLDSVNVVFSATGIKAGQWLSGGRAEHLWEWDNLRVPEIWWLRAWNGPSAIFGLKWPTPDSDPETLRWRMEQAERQGKKFVPPGAEPDDWMINSWTSVRPSVAERMTKESPRYRARLWFELSTPRLDFEMPLREGERRIGAGHSLRLVLVNNAGPSFHAIETRPFLAIEFLREALNRVLWFRDLPTSGYLLLNRNRGEFVGLRGDFLSSPGETPTVPIYGVGINPRGPVPFGRRVIRGGKFVQLPGWLETTTLALVTMKQEAVFFRDVGVDRLPVRNAPDAARQGRRQSTVVEAEP